MTSPETKIAVVRDIYEAINSGNIDALSGLLSEDCVRHYVKGTAPIAGDHVGREAVLDSYRHLFEWTHGTHHCEVGNVLANGLLAASYHQETARRMSDGRHLDAAMLVRWHFDDSSGKVVEIRDYANDVPGLNAFLTGA